MPANPAVKIAKIPIPGSPMKAFDISWVDAQSGKYYLADRSNGTVDVVDIATNRVSSQIGGFVGFRGKNSLSGPDGVLVTISGKELWAGDGDSTVKVIDLTTNTITDTISTGGKFRDDEMAYDPVDGLLLVANNDDDPAFLSFISTNTHQVLGKITYPDATDGVEQPVYDSETGMFYLSVPGTKAHEGGQIDVIDPKSMKVVASYMLDDCEPHGLTSGPMGSSQMLAGCSLPNRAIVLNKWTGKVMADFTNTGGADEVWYNPTEKRYYMASSSQNLGIIDASTLTMVENVESGINAHSVAVDPVTNHVFVPVAAPDPACPTGCIAVYASPLTDRPSKR